MSDAKTTGGEMLKYPTKQKRCVAIFDTYCKVHGVTSATMEAVSEWAITNKLYPCPRRGDPVEICVLWETLLELAVSSAGHSAGAARDGR